MHNEIHATSDRLLNFDSCELIFDSKINLCNDLIDIFNDAIDILESSTHTIYDDKIFDIEMTHPRGDIINDADLLLLLFSTVYYDCWVTLKRTAVPKYNIRVIDGYVRSLRRIN